MPWQGIYGHDRVVEQFRRCLERWRLASSFLFVGPEGIGKRTFALKLAQALLCQRHPEAQLDPCQKCPSCVAAAAGTHPDIDLVSKPPERSFIPLAMFIGEDNKRMQDGLCHRLGLKAFMGRRKIAIVDDADLLNVEGANCLLKTLEEPPPQSVLILIGTSADKQLPTIRSRCQIIRFDPLPITTVAELLVAQGLLDDPAAAPRLARFSEGSLSRALELADSELWAFRSRLLGTLSRPHWESVRLAAELNEFIEAAGKEAPSRRARARQVLAFTADFLRQLIRLRSGAALTTDDRELREVVEKGQAAWRGGAESLTAALEYCLEAHEQIDRIALVPNVMEHWLDRLVQLAETGRVSLESAAGASP
jgi:DNA polymerase-3 subunit delta'